MIMQSQVNFLHCFTAQQRGGLVALDQLCVYMNGLYF